MCRNRVQQLENSSLLAGFEHAVMVQPRFNCPSDTFAMEGNMKGQKESKVICKR